MSITINLEPDVENQLRERAAQEGQAAEGLAAILLNNFLPVAFSGMSDASDRENEYAMD